VTADTLADVEDSQPLALLQTVLGLRRRGAYPAGSPGRGPACAQIINANVGARILT
jgi:hypothetical protein